MCNIFATDYLKDLDNMSLNILKDKKVKIEYEIKDKDKVWKKKDKLEWSEKWYTQYHKHNDNYHDS